MRAATDAETAATIAFFEAVEPELAGKIIGINRVVVCVREGIAFACLASPDVLALPPELVAAAGAAGLPIGTLEDDGFHLDLQGAVLMARHTKAQTVRVTEHSARLFLYSRNVLGDSIEWRDPELELGDACIVTSPRGEAMGIGIVVGSFKGAREAVRPVHDLGTYLRDQTEGE